MATSPSESPSTDRPQQSVGKGDDAKPHDHPSITPHIPTSHGMKEVVRLNVGGTRYEVSRDTLTRYEGSMLSSLVSGKWKEGEGQNEIFIDRDGLRFSFILDYLRSDRIHLNTLSDRSALKEEFEYYGIDADMSKISVKDDFVSLHELVNEIKEHEAAIEQKKLTIAAIKESYRLAGDFTNRAEGQGLFLRHAIKGSVDKELLRSCLLSRGLHVVSYISSEAGHLLADILPIGMEKTLK